MMERTSLKDKGGYARDKEHDRAVRAMRLYGPACLVCSNRNTIRETKLCLACWLRQREKWRHFMAGSKYETGGAGERRRSVERNASEVGTTEVSTPAQDSQQDAGDPIMPETGSP